jgi:hypothetical protein
MSAVAVRPTRGHVAPFGGLSRQAVTDSAQGGDGERQEVGEARLTWTQTIEISQQFARPEIVLLPGFLRRS